MSRDTSFYYSFLVLPSAQRRAIIAVWDFCRAADDAVDAQPDESRTRAELQTWKRELDAVYGAIEPSTPQGRALKQWVAAFSLSRANFDALLSGVEMDLQPRRFERFDDLRDYAERVASSVGAVCIEIFGVRDPAAAAYAYALGLALQLTNILRDVPADLAAGRIYLVGEDQEAAGCTDEMLRASAAAGRIADERVRQVLGMHAVRTRAEFRRVADVFPREHRRKLVAAEIMNAVYRRLFEKITARDFDVFRERVTVPRPERARVALGVYLRTLAGLHRPRP